MSALATSPLPSGGSPTREQNHKLPTCEHVGYITRGSPTLPLPSWGVPNKGTKSEVLRIWADWLHQPHLLERPQQGDKIRISPRAGGLATSPLPSGGVPHKGGKSERDPTWADWQHHPCRLGVAQQGGKIRNGLASGLTTSPLPFRIPQQWYKFRNGLHAGGLATSPLPSRGSPTRGENLKWPTRGRTGSITPAV